MTKTKCLMSKAILYKERRKNCTVLLHLHERAKTTVAVFALFVFVMRMGKGNAAQKLCDVCAVLLFMQLITPVSIVLSP